MSTRPANDCTCLKDLDKLRLAHEQGTVRRFAVFYTDEQGIMYFGHKVDATFLLDVARGAINQAEERLEEE